MSLERHCSILVSRINSDLTQIKLGSEQTIGQGIMATSGKRFFKLAGMTASIAGKAAKEVAYHIRHTGEWVIRLGDGTEESALRMADAVTELHPYVEELFTMSDDARVCASAGQLPDRETLRDAWAQTISNIFDQALLDVPEVAFPQLGGRTGHHGEEMGHLLSQLQYVQRAYPGMSW